MSDLMTGRDEVMDLKNEEVLNKVLASKDSYDELPFTCSLNVQSALVSIDEEGTLYEQPTAHTL